MATVAPHELSRPVPVPAVESVDTRPEAGGREYSLPAGSGQRAEIGSWSTQDVL